MELKKRALKVVESLLEDSVAEDFLVDCAKFITRANYRDAVEERSIAKMCGYPICPNKLGKMPTQQYKICTKTNRVYDMTERKITCSLPFTDSPPNIKLMEKGDGERSGEEVMLSETHLKEEDIDSPLTAQPEEHRSSSQCLAAGGT
ncbi:hypothetical protein F2P81_020322 [Scophthalmus maximus]|uniref:RNA polymerase II subunit B1 CTD phosphatase RPAP2 homolog n=1 Tax=Scophthalmus maximus TaxID=52904 RepID=A0A6A4S920_SCOMX|nr:hypothetical protein F2P81_020322 [Scophthalmus maximus]